MRYIKSKKGIEVSFAWIFSILVGIIILIGAIYGASKFVNTAQYTINTKTAKDLTNIFNPLQTSVESGKVTSISLITNTRIYTSCDNNGDFGENRIQLSEKGSVKSDWGKPGGDIGINNQYIFANEIIEGKQIHFFIKAFNMPFKTADLMMMYSDNYCFVNPPQNMKNELESLSFSNESNFNVKTSIRDCENQTTICFDSEGCNIGVYCSDIECSQGYVKKLDTNQNQVTLYFIDSLVYGAIFGSPENYECNVMRIMKRIDYLSQLYRKKALFTSIRGCDSGLQQDMNDLSAIAGNFTRSDQLFNIQTKANEIKLKNQELECQLF